MNIDVARGTYFRGMKLALAEIDRRYGGDRVEDEGFVDRILLSKSDPRQQVLPSETDSHVRHSDPPKAASRLPQSVPMTDLSKFADDVILHNARDDHWDDKTQRQASISCVRIHFPTS